MIRLDGDHLRTDIDQSSGDASRARANLHDYRGWSQFAAGCEEFVDPFGIAGSSCLIASGVNSIKSAGFVP